MRRGMQYSGIIRAIKELRGSERGSLDLYMHDDFEEEESKKTDLSQEIEKESVSEQNKVRAMHALASIKKEMQVSQGDIKSAARILQSLRTTAIYEERPGVIDPKKLLELARKK